MTRRIAVIGDRFMLPSLFVEALEKIPAALDIRTLEQPWPDEPMVHGYAGTGLYGLKEFMGDPDEIVEFIGDAEILVTHLAPISAGMLERLPELKLVGVSRGGPVNIDMKAAKARGVKVVNAPGRNASAVAEFTIGAILAETRLITRGHTSLSQGQWRGDLYRADLTGRELSEMTVGVIGYGHVGSKVVRLLKAFGCRILVTDPYVQLDPADSADGVQQVALETLLAESDVVTLRGAMLETFAVEPPPEDWPLLKLPNVTLTPHIAGASVKTVTYAAGLIAEDVRRYLAGEPLLRLC